VTIRHILQSIVKYYLYCLAYCIWIESLEASIVGGGSGDGTHVIYDFAGSVAEGAQSYFT
jgi:hypothetical protein